MEYPKFAAPELVGLELIVDAKGLSHTIDALAEICQLKAEHLGTNWQDKQASDLWGDAAELLGKIAQREVITRVS